VNEILSLIQHPSPQALLHGKDASRLSHDLITDLASRGTPVHVFDCAIRFNVFRIADRSRLNEFQILHRIFIQRAFTPYQLLDSVGELISKHKDPSIRSKFYFFLNPTKQFFDGDVKDQDRDYLLPILAKQFGTLRELGFQFIISESKRFEQPIFQKYFAEIQRSAVHYILDCTTSFLPANHAYPGLFGTDG